MRIAYLINQYPKVSHSFIRREILAIEQQGVTIVRISVRATARKDLVDPDDLAELDRTKVLLRAGAINLLLASVLILLQRPANFFRTLRLAIQCGRNSDRGLLRHFIYLAEACLLLKWLKSEQIQHVHAHFGTNPTTVVMLCRSLGGPPYSFTVHGPDEFDRPQQIRLGEKIARAAFVVAITSFCRSQLYRWSDYRDWDKIKIIHCGVDQKFLAAEPEPIRNVRQFVCVGRLCAQKGQLLLVKAAAMLAREGYEFRLVFVGDGELRAPIEALIAEYGLQKQIVITGWASADQVHQHLLDSAAMCLPSFAEGLPVVAMESLALARPVLATWIAGHPELMEDKQTGYMFPAGSVTLLADAMRQSLRATPEELAAMGQEGRKRVEAMHDIRIEAGKLKDLFQGTRLMAEDGNT